MPVKYNALTFDDLGLSVILRPAAASPLDEYFLVTCTLGTGGRFSLEGDLPPLPPENIFNQVHS